MYMGIAEAVVGNRLSDVSHAVQTHVEKSRLRCCDGVRRPWELAGSCMKSRRCRIGRTWAGPSIAGGDGLAIEPMVNMGGAAVKGP